MTDAQSHHYHEFTGNRQNWAIDRWCRELKISRTKLEQHPYFEDVVTLLMFDEWQEHMTFIDRQIWTHCWQHSYHREYPLTQYHKNKLRSIVSHIQLRQTAQAHIQARKQKQSAKACRKQGFHNDDNRPCSPDLVATDLEQ
jgi:hypothetical protein